jgi:rRNA biogenesis protein RRP5
VQVEPRGEIGFLAKASYNGDSHLHLQNMSIGKKLSAIVSGSPKSSSLYPKKMPLLMFPPETYRTRRERADSYMTSASTSDTFVRRGAIVDGTISDITETCIKVDLAGDMEGEIFLTDLIDLGHKTCEENVANRMRSYVVGSKISSRCLWVADQVSVQRDNVAQLTLRESEMSGKSFAKRYSWKDASQLMSINTLFGVVQDIVEEGAWIALSPTLKGFVFASNCSTNDNVDVLNALGVAGVLQKGQIVPCRALSVDDKKHRLELSLRAEDINNLSLSFRSPGTFVIGKALSIAASGGLKVTNAPAINIQVSKTLYGRICVTHLADQDGWVDVPFGRTTTKSVKPGMPAILPGRFVRCVVLSNQNSQLDLSLRPSVLLAAEQKVQLKSVLECDEFSNYETGDIIKAYVVKTVKQGCFVRLSPSVTARVTIANLSDQFIKHADKVFYPSKLVTGKIITTDIQSRRIEISLKASVVNEGKAKKDKDLVTFHSLKIGQYVDAVVSKVQSYGIFVKLADSGSPGVSALCHISEATDKFVKDLTKVFHAGDLVKAKVVKKDPKTKKISISLKPSNFNPTEEDKTIGSKIRNFSSDSESVKHDSSDNEVEMTEENGPSDSEQSDSDDEIAEGVSSESEHEDESDSVSDSSSEDSESETTKMKIVDDPTKFSFKGFQSFARVKCPSDQEDDNDGSSSDRDEYRDKIRGKTSRSSRQKARSRRLEEAAIVAQEEALLGGKAIPETVNDFERLVVSSPNSSFAWIKYMAYQLSLTEIDLARGIAERALDKISYREEKEKLNIWLAYLNLEYKYGVESTFDALFNRAIRINDPIVVFLRMAKIYVDAEDYEAAKDLYTKAIKKFGSKSPVVWIDYGSFAIKTNDLHVTFKSVLVDALHRLPEREHVAIITKFAIMEFKHGSSERGRTIFEELVGNYPKRMDVWNMYLDQEISLNTEKGNLKRVRRLFDRIISMKFSSKKMKFIFKKYLQFEQLNGTEDGEENVKKMAREWVESK